jgi:hypothetical protein
MTSNKSRLDDRVDDALLSGRDSRLWFALVETLTTGTSRADRIGRRRIAPVRHPEQAKPVGAVAAVDASFSPATRGFLVRRRNTSVRHRPSVGIRLVMWCPRRCARLGVGQTALGTWPAPSLAR